MTAINVHLNCHFFLKTIDAFKKEKKRILNHEYMNICNMGATGFLDISIT